MGKLSLAPFFLEREQVYADMAHWLLRSEQPVIVIDWPDLESDKS